MRTIVVSLPRDVQFIFTLSASLTGEMEERMTKILYNVQFNKTDHQQYVKELKKLYDKVDFDKFWKCFVECLKVVLMIGSEHPHVINTFEFYSKFTISFNNNTEDENEETQSPFLKQVFNFLLLNHKAKSKVVRYRICQFLATLLAFMGDNAFIDDELCDQITIHMMDRLMDKSPKVRAQAVHALQRLQDPSNEQCPVIKMYLFHLSKDPAVQVRKAILSTMGKNQQTLCAALKRTRDIDESVRKMAYVFIAKITVRSLTIQQRERLLKDGLKDRAESVKSCVNDVLLPMWLRHYKEEYVTLIHALDVGTGTETAVLALEALFKKSRLETLLEQVPIDKQTKLIPLANLSNDNVLYWRCLIHHLERLSCTEQIDLILPELSRFCSYIREYIVASSNQQDKWEMQRHQFILLQLFEIVKTYDLSDEVGRQNLRDLINDTLLSYPCSERIIECIVAHLVKVIPDNNSRLEAVATIISEIRLPSKDESVEQQITAEQEQQQNFEKAKLQVELLELEEEMYEAAKNKDFLKADNIKEKLTVLKEKMEHTSTLPTTEITIDEEKNDPETMKLCLSILCAAIQAQPLKALTPSLRSLKPFALDSINYADNNVHILALKVLCLYCILDKELDRKYSRVFVYQFSREQENPEMWVVALKCIFDLLLIYGLDYFKPLQHTDKSQSAEQNDTHSAKKNKKQDKSKNNRTLHTSRDSISSVSAQTEKEENVYDIMKFLIKLLDNQNQDLRTIAVEGFCKLLLNRQINNDGLLSQLIITCYNPANAEDFYLRQCLSTFFDHFVVNVPEALKMLTNAYFLTLQTLCDMLKDNSLQNVDTYHVSIFMLNLMKQACQKFVRQTFYVHELALRILSEILDPNSKIDQKILIKSLTKLHIEVEDNSMKQKLQEAIGEVMKTVRRSREKQMLKYIQDFQKRLEDPEKTTDSTHEEEESENED